MAQFTRAPTSDIATGGTIARSSGTTNYTLVNDYPDTADPLTSYVTLGTTANSFFVCGFTNFDIPAGSTINWVEVQYYDEEPSNGANTAAGRIRVNATYYDASTHNPSTTTTARADRWTTNPAGGSWTVDQVNNVGGTGLNAFGVIGPDSNPVFRVGAMRLVVDFTYPTVTITQSTAAAATASGSAAAVHEDIAGVVGAATASGSTADSVTVVSAERGRVAWVQLETPTAGTQISASVGAATATGSAATMVVVIVTNVEQMVAWGWDAAFTETMGTATGTATAQGPPADVSVGADVTLTSTAPGTGTASGLGASIYEEVLLAAAVGTATASGAQASLTALNTAQVTWVELEFPTAGTQITGAVGTATASGSTAAVEFVVVAAVGTATAEGLLAATGSDAVVAALVGEATASGSTAALDAGVAAAVGTATAAGSAATVVDVRGWVSWIELEVPEPTVTTIAASVGTATAEQEGAGATFVETMGAFVGTATASGLAFVSNLPIAAAVGTATATGAWSTVTLSAIINAGIGTATAGNYDFVLSQGEAGRVTWVQLEIPNTGRVSIYSGAPAVSYAVGLKAGVNFTANAAVGTATAAGLSPFIASDFTCFVGTSTASGSTAAIFDGYVSTQVGTATASAYDFYLAEISEPVNIPAYVGTATAAGLKSAHPIPGHDHGRATWVQFEVPVYTGATYTGGVGNATARGSAALIYDDAQYYLDAPLVLGVSVQLGLTATFGYSIGDIPATVGTATAGGATAGISVDAAFDLDAALELPISIQLGLSGTLIIQSDIVTAYVGTATAEGSTAEYLDVVNVVVTATGVATAEGLQSAISWADHYPAQVATATAAGQRANVSYSVWCFPGTASAYKTVAVVFQGEQVSCTTGVATAAGSTADAVLGGVHIPAGVGVSTAAGLKAGIDFGLAAKTGTSTASGAVADIRMLLGFQAAVGTATAQGSAATLYWSEFIAAAVGRAYAYGGRADTGLLGTPSFYNSWATDERGVTEALLEQRLRGIIVEARSANATKSERESTGWIEDFGGA